MARPNDTLKGMAAALATELGLPAPDFGDLKNDGLEALVADLEAQKAARPPAPPGPPAPPPPVNGPPPIDGAAGNDLGGAPPPPPPPEPVVPPGSVSVAPGGSIVCLRGHLDAGTVVTANDFGAGKVGEENLADLLARGALVKS